MLSLLMSLTLLHVIFCDETTPEENNVITTFIPKNNITIPRINHNTVLEQEDSLAHLLQLL